MKGHELVAPKLVATVIPVWPMCSSVAVRTLCDALCNPFRHCSVHCNLGRRADRQLNVATQYKEQVCACAEAPADEASIGISLLWMQKERNAIATTTLCATLGTVMQLKR